MGDFYGLFDVKILELIFIFRKDSIIMRCFILYNPLSGNGGAKARSEELKNTFGDGASAVDMTKIESYAGLLADLGEDDAIVICGGDGTLNRFANDISELDVKCDILYAATGTGNDFLNDLGKKTDEAPFSVKKYITDLPEVTVKGKKYRFMNGIGFGIDGYCCEEGDKLKAENPEVPVNYTSIAIKGLLGKFKPSNGKVVVDGVEKSFKKIWIAASMHGRYYGGGMMCAPDQDRLAEDGMNTLVVWYGTGKLSTLMAFPSIFKGEHVKKTRMISVMRGREIRVEFEKPCALQIDGETVHGVTEYTVKSAAAVRERVEV